MNGDGTVLWLFQTEHTCGHVWQRYSMAIYNVTNLMNLFIAKFGSSVVNVGTLLTAGMLLPKKYLLLVGICLDYELIVYVF